MAVVLLALFFPNLVALAHGGDLDVVVEVASHTDGFEYGLAVLWSDGDPVTGANILIRADQGGLTEATEPIEVAPGVYVGRLRLPEIGDWRMSIAIRHPDSSGDIEFSQTVTDDGTPVWLVAVDTANPHRVGAAPEPGRGILDAPSPAATTTTVHDDPTTTSTPVATTASSSHGHETAAGDVVIDLSADSPNLVRDIGLRLAHLSAIGLWIVPVIAAVLGRQSRRSVVLALVGVSLTIASGALLMAWGAPIRFPGIFNWGGFAGISYGSAYLTTFAVKLLGVLLAVAATVRWAMKTDRRAAWATLGAVAIALVAVTAMTQFHVLSHG